MGGISAFELHHAGGPALRTFGSIARRRSSHRPWRSGARPATLMKSGSPLAAAAIGEGDLEHLGKIMDRGGRAEAELCDIMAFENVEHLCDMHAGGRGRRRPRICQPR